MSRSRENVRKREYIFVLDCDEVKCVCAYFFLAKRCVRAMVVNIMSVFVCVQLYDSELRRASQYNDFALECVLLG